MRRNQLTIIFLLCLAAVSCRKDSIEVVTTAANRVTLVASSVTLSPNGSAGILFRASGLPETIDVSLRLRDGSEPQFFHVTGVEKKGDSGAYEVTVTDGGVFPAYSMEACIIVCDGSGVQCSTTSDYICVNCGASDFQPAVSTGLPVIYIDTEGHRAIESKSIELPATLKIRGDGGYADMPPGSCNVRGRGNASWKWDKKPLKVTFRDRVPMLGMPEADSWILLANFIDRTLMRNIVAMKVSSLSSLSWTPRCVPVELVLNGRHEGNYLLIEQVEVDENRLDVSCSDGFLLETDFHYDNDVQWLDPHGVGFLLLGTPFAVRYPQPGLLDEDKESYIKDYVTQTANAIYSKDFKDPQTGYGKWIDTGSFIDYWIVNEVLGNLDIASPGSIFLHKDAGGKLTAGPCWDFDWCLTDYATTVQEWTGTVVKDVFWYSRLFKDPEFTRRAAQRFDELLPDLQGIADYIDGCGTQLAASAELNFALWNPADDRWKNKGLLVNGDEELSFSEAVTLLRQVYLRRLDLIKQYFLKNE